MSKNLDELGNEILNLIKNNGKKCIVYEKFTIYEDLFHELKDPSLREQAKYMNLEFKYIEFIGK